jgi:hypothetical protein
MLGKEPAKQEATTDVTLFIGEGEREEATPVPHVCVRMLTASRTGWTTAWRWDPCPGLLTSGPRSVFSNLVWAQMGWAALFINPAR